MDAQTGETIGRHLAIKAGTASGVDDHLALDHVSWAIQGALGQYEEPNAILIQDSRVHWLTGAGTDDALVTTFEAVVTENENVTSRPFVNLKARTMPLRRRDLTIDFDSQLVDHQQSPAGKALETTWKFNRLGSEELRLEGIALLGLDDAGDPFATDDSEAFARAVAREVGWKIVR